MKKSPCSFSALSPRSYKDCLGRLEPNQSLASSPPLPLIPVPAWRSTHIRQWLSLLFSQPENEWVGSRPPHLSSDFLKSQILIALPTEALPLPLPFHQKWKCYCNSTQVLASKICVIHWFPEKHLSGTRVKEQPRRGHWSLSPGLSGFGMGRGRGFPDVPLKGWMGARRVPQIYKGMPVPQECTMQSQKLSEESAGQSGQGPQRDFSSDHLPLSSLPPVHSHHSHYTPSPSTHMHVYFPQTTSSGSYSNKAKANRVWKSSKLNSKHTEGQRK